MKERWKGEREVEEKVEEGRVEGRRDRGPGVSILSIAAPLAPFSSLHPCPWEEGESRWVELMEEAIGLLAKGGLFPPSYLSPSLCQFHLFPLPMPLSQHPPRVPSKPPPHSTLVPHICRQLQQRDLHLGYGDCHQTTDALGKPSSCLRRNN